MNVATRVGRLLGASPRTTPPLAPAAPADELSVPGAALDIGPQAALGGLDGLDAELSALLADGFTASPDPKFADLEAAVALVASGVATHVILAGFPSWPGLLWRANELAREAGVSIVPRLPGGDGHVDLEVTGDVAGGD